jgi:hypothetical protein
MVWRWLRRFGGSRWTLGEGETLSRTGRDEYEYCLNGRCTTFQADLLLAKGRDCVIYPSTIERWLPPHEGPIDEAEGERIAQRVCTFLISQGIAAEVYRG